jgi:hypothetical protein
MHLEVKSHASGQDEAFKLKLTYCYLHVLCFLKHPISEEVEQQLRQILGTFCVDALELGRCTKQFCLLEHILSAKNIMDYYRIVRVANPRQLQGTFDQ